ncbi:hypothetical protein MLD38_029254 [Melastoma candidum]|uniref:Uncharacterized protein n=1 Tax=Melastoma candidum TaxID=119954 RepID=A0ACB9N900_9MYRT|nr:hypothetical protein MLD38_029254 [Melastoma candidum]
MTVIKAHTSTQQQQQLQLILLSSFYECSLVPSPFSLLNHSLHFLQLYSVSFLRDFASPEGIRVRTHAAIMNLVLILGVVLCFPLANAKTASPPSPSPLSPTPSPAPAPAPDYVNLTDLLTVAGPFHKFLSYLVSTKVLDTFQNQANNTEEGVTIFVPKDGAFSSQKNPSLANLTQDQLKSLLLFHGLPHYYTLADFTQLSQSSPISTFAGSSYSLNFTDNSGTVHLSSGWTHTKISSSVHSTDPVSIFQIDKVLLPEAIFGTDIPPTPAPAPAPDVSPVADTPAGSIGAGSTASSPKNDASSKHMVRRIYTKSLLGSSLALALVMFA